MKSLPMPRSGGSYVRQPDGSLVRQFEISGDGAGEALPEVDQSNAERVAAPSTPRAPASGVRKSKPQ